MEFWQQPQMQKMMGANDPFGGRGQDGGFSSAWQQDAMNRALGDRPAMQDLTLASLGSVMDPRPATDEMEESSGWGDYLLGALEKGLGALDQYDGKLTDVMYPSRSAIQWTPRENPGLAGLMRQIDAMSGRAYGR